MFIARTVCLINYVYIFNFWSAAFRREKRKWPGDVKRTCGCGAPVRPPAETGAGRRKLRCFRAIKRELPRLDRRRELGVRAVDGSQITARVIAVPLLRRFRREAGKARRESGARRVSGADVRTREFSPERPAVSRADDIATRKAIISGNFTGYQSRARDRVLRVYLISRMYPSSVSLALCNTYF